MLRPLLALFLLLPLVTGAQRVPYSMFRPLQEASDSLAAVDGVACALRVDHANPEDNRPFSMFLESPGTKTEIKVADTGVFRLPLLPQEDWSRAEIVHSLEKGALNVQFHIGLCGPATAKKPTLFAICSELAQKLRNIPGLRECLAQTNPRYGDPQVAVVGVAFRRALPIAGKVILQRGEQTVASLDLSQTGEAAWMFDQYDPKTHRMVWEMKKGQTAPPAEMVFVTGPKAAATTGAVFLWKAARDGGETDGKQPAPAGTNSPAAGSRR